MIVLGRDRSDQRLDPDDVHDPCQIVGQHRESHLGGNFTSTLTARADIPKAVLTQPRPLADIEY